MPTDDVKSVQNLVINTEWMTEYSHSFSRDLQWNNQLQLMKSDVPQFQGFAFVMNRGTCAMQRAMNVHLYNTFIELQWNSGTKAKMLQHCLIHYCNIRSVWLDSIISSIHVMLYAVCVVPLLLYAIIHWLSFRHMSSYGVYSFLEAFEFCCSSFADEHNT